MPGFQNHRLERGEAGKSQGLAVVCGQRISPVETLSSHGAGCFAAQVLGDDAGKVQVGGARDQYGFGHQTHLVIGGALQPQTLHVSRTGRNIGECISVDIRHPS